MRLRIPILILLSVLTITIKGQEQKWEPSAIMGLTFKEFVDITQNIFKIRIFYKDEWVEGITTAKYPEDFTLNKVLDSLFSGKHIFYFRDRSGNIVLTKDFTVKRSEGPVTGNEEFIPPSSVRDVSEDHQVKENQFIVIGKSADRNIPGKGIVSGFITNSVTHLAVSGATIIEKQLLTGTVSNQLGFYSVSLPKGIHTITFSFLGMKEKNVNIDLTGTGELNIEMTEVLIPIKEAVVSAEKNIVLQRFEVGMEKINLTSFRLSPTTIGESDIIKSILMVPGVKSVGEGSAGFNVRGGSADQNLILLYDAPVYSSSHFFGFFSAINPDIISDLTLYKGGIPSRYGGRISSVLEISAKEGNRQSFRGSAGISPITTHAYIEGPLIKDTLSYFLAARTTYSNWIFKLIDYTSLQKISASFYDINGRMTWVPDKNNKIEFSSYVSHDNFRLGSDSVYNYNNNIESLTWHHFFSNSFFSTLTANHSFYKFAVLSKASKPESFILSHEVNSTGLKADFNWLQGRNEANFGLDLLYYFILPGSYLPASDSSLITPRIIKKERALESALYFEDKFSLTSFLALNLGIRLSSLLTFGPAKELVYRPGFSKSRSTIIDTLHFANGAVSSKYAGPELRLSMNFRISPKNSIKLNYNKTRQYIHLLSNSTSISPTDTWKLSDYNLKPEIGNQVALGFYQLLFKNRLEASAEIYYKTIRNMTDFKGGANLIVNENIIEEMVNVNGKAYGLEVSLTKQQGKLRFDLGYTFSRIFLKNASDFKEEIINNGKWFPANFDRPNDLNITVNYLFSRRLSFSADYTYNTGRPITYPVATYHMYNDIYVHYSDRNKYRIPDYSRLDFSFKIGGNLRLHRIAKPSWTFSVYNLLGRKNVYSVYFRQNGDVIKGYKLSVFGQAIPSVTLNLDF